MERDRRLTHIIPLRFGHHHFRSLGELECAERLCGLLSIRRDSADDGDARSTRQCRLEETREFGIAERDMRVGTVIISQERNVVSSTQAMHSTECRRSERGMRNTPPRFRQFRNNRPQREQTFVNKRSFLLSIELSCRRFTTGQIDQIQAGCPSCEARRRIRRFDRLCMPPAFH